MERERERIRITGVTSFLFSLSSSFLSLSPSFEAARESSSSQLGFCFFSLFYFSFLSWVMFSADDLWPTFSLFFSSLSNHQFFLSLIYLTLTFLSFDSFTYSVLVIKFPFLTSFLPLFVVCHPSPEEPQGSKSRRRERERERKEGIFEKQEPR